MAHTPDIPASSTLAAFLAPGLDRCAFIASWLGERNIPHSIIELAGKRHIVVRFSAEAYDPLFRMKTIVAHYDRASGTPGANDNSAACFQLMLFAGRLQSARSPAGGSGSHNIRIFFTDGEEAAGTKGIAAQGSFALGEGLRKLGMTDSDVYVFDACGRGDTIVVSTAGQGRKTGPALAGRLSELHEQALRLANEAAPGAWLRLPTPYSDNAGFLAAGIASQVFTLLPRKEAEALNRAVNGPDSVGGQRDIDDAIVGHGSLTENDPLRKAIPETWRLMHTKKDSAATLTASAFRLMETLLDGIARERHPIH